jgi:hypothetical protein
MNMGENARPPVICIKSLTRSMQTSWPLSDIARISRVQPAIQDGLFGGLVVLEISGEKGRARLMISPTPSGSGSSIFTSVSGMGCPTVLNQLSSRWMQEMPLISVCP